MKPTQKFLAVAIVTLSLGATMVQAKDVNPNRMKPLIMHKGPPQVMQFVKNNDYEGFKNWVEQNDKTAMAEKVTPERFAKMVELYNAVESKDWETVKKLKEEIGFKGPGFGPGPKMMHKGMEKMHEKLSQLPEEVQTQLQEAFQNRDHEKVKQILEANGVELPKMKIKMKMVE